MLSASGPTEFALAIISEDVDMLKKMPGIGAKSAARIILELKDKMKKEEAITGSNSSKITKAVKNDEKVEEAIAALCVLGYNKGAIEKAFVGVDKNNLSTEELIKMGLSLLSKN